MYFSTKRNVQNVSIRPFIDNLTNPESLMLHNRSGKDLGNVLRAPIVHCDDLIDSFFLRHTLPALAFVELIRFTQGMAYGAVAVTHNDLIL
jgi:hypothetical protein